LAADVGDLATRYEDILIDAGGQDSFELRAAMAIAALAIFPDSTGFSGKISTY